MEGHGPVRRLLRSSRSSSSSRNYSSRSYSSRSTTTTSSRSNGFSQGNGPVWLVPVILGGALLLVVLVFLYKWKTKWSKEGLPPPLQAIGLVWKAIHTGQVPDQCAQMDEGTPPHERDYADEPGKRKGREHSADFEASDTVISTTPVQFNSVQATPHMPSYPTANTYASSPPHDVPAYPDVAAHSPGGGTASQPMFGNSEYERNVHTAANTSNYPGI